MKLSEIPRCAGCQKYFTLKECASIPPETLARAIAPDGAIPEVFLFHTRCSHMAAIYYAAGLLEEQPKGKRSTR